MQEMNSKREAMMLSRINWMYTKKQKLYYTYQIIKLIHSESSISFPASMILGAVTIFCIYDPWYSLLTCCSSSGNLRGVLVGVAGAGGGPVHHPPGGAQDAVCQQLRDNCQGKDSISMTVKC